MFRSTCCSLVLALGLVPGAFAQTPASMRITVDSARREVAIVLGPYHVASDAGMEDMPEMDMGSMPRIVSPRFAWPVTAWVRGFQVTVEDSLGHALPRRLLHHYGVLDFDRRELAYPVIQHLLGGGAETPDVTLPKTPPGTGWPCISCGTT